jgi:cyclopropane-fatty-acyl-phospholipid synthase
MTMSNGIAERVLKEFGAVRAMTRTNGSAEGVVKELFALAGVTVDGPAPTDPRVKNPAFYGRFLGQASLGLAESFMDEWWDVPQLDGFIDKLLRAKLRDKLKGNLRLTLLSLKAMFTNMQSVHRADQVAKAHYDLGNDLYRAMLDKRMVYTCGYWKRARSLDEAQEHKLDLVCRKAGLQKGMRVLDLGCGWGGLAAWAAEKYGVEVVGISISREQVELARQMWKGLPVEFRLGDYRSITGTYDAVLSVGLLEHIGPKNYCTFMELVDRTLKPEGVAVLHTIGNNISRIHADPFTQKYIFPNACSPALSQLAKAMEGLFIVEDMHNIGPDYDPTLTAWWANFDKAWPTLRGQRYDDRFYRMWKFYLLGAAGLSRSRDGQLYQLVITKTGRSQPDCRQS